MATEAARGQVDPVLYKLLAEQTRDYAVFLLDTEGRVITWNVGAQRIKQYAAEEIIGRHFSTFYTRDAIDRAWPAYELKVAAREGRFEDEGWRVRRDGSRFWANVVITALTDESGKLLAYSKITRDLTERRQHEEALRLSEERFRLLVDGVLDYAIFMLDTNGIVTSWNAGAQRMKGYRAEEIIGEHFSRFYLQEDLDAGKPAQELVTARTTGRAEEEGWRLKKGGEPFWARVIVTALRDPQGLLLGYAKVTQDLTERRHVQDLEKATKNVTEFIAVLAHELRNPLAPIRNAVHVLTKIPAGDPAHDPMLRTIDRQSGHLARILDDLLDISRVTRGGLAIERGPVDLADVVRRAVETSMPSIEAGRHALQIELPEEPVVVEGDVHRLTQLAANLLNNAARYTPEGGSITVSGGREGGRAVLRVRDTGRGIDPQIIDRIFDMFVQGQALLQRVGGGLGIGLALARKIAELHGGTLEAHSEGENRGSEFTLRLPLSDSGERRDECAQAQPAVADGAIRPRRVLVVDDNVDAATTLELLLRSLGHETRVAYDGTQALQVAPEFQPDLVLLDIGMPGLDGYEVARRLRALQSGRALRIVAVSGWGQERDRAQSEGAGIDLHLVKPVDRNALERLLAESGGTTLAS